MFKSVDDLFLVILKFVVKSRKIWRRSRFYLHHWICYQVWEHIRQICRFPTSDSNFFGYRCRPFWKIDGLKSLFVFAFCSFILALGISKFTLGKQAQYNFFHEKTALILSPYHHAVINGVFLSDKNQGRQVVLLRHRERYDPQEALIFQHQLNLLGLFSDPWN